MLDASLYLGKGSATASSHVDFELNMAVWKTPEMTEQLTQMLRRIEEGQIGFDATLQGPYGAKRSKS